MGPLREFPPVCNLAQVITCSTAPALFGRDLIEQTRADAARGDDRSIPVIVEKCINAVEKSGELTLLPGCLPVPHADL